MELGNELGPLEAQSSAEQVAQLLRRMIALGAFSPGQRLPSERKLAEMLRVGRDSVRAATRTLGEEGLVETRRGCSGGTFVSDEPPKRRFEVELQDYRHEISNAYEFRGLIEPAAARLAAHRASAREAQAIAAIAQETAWSIRSYRGIDARFHTAVAHGSGNHLLVEAVHATRAAFFVWYDALYSRFEWDTLPRENRDFPFAHKPIADAILAREPVAASRLMSDHLKQTEGNLLEMLDAFAVSR